jgi:diguanylate cyclase (GGDEF)-like protein
MHFKNFQSVKYTHSLVIKLIVLAIVLVLSGSVVRYLVIQSTLKSGITEVVNAQQLSMGKYVAEDIDTKIKARKQFLERLSGELPRQALTHPEELRKWLKSNDAIAPLFSFGVAVIAEDGRGAIADFPALPGRSELDFNDRDWFRQARDKGEFAIGKPGTGRAAKVAVVNMAVPIRNDQQKIIGVLMGVTALNSPGFLDLVQKGIIGNSGGMLLISPRDKMFVTASNPAMRLQPTPEVGINLLHDKSMLGWRGTGVTVNAQGEEELVAVTDVPSAQWFLVVRTPSSEAFRTMDKLLSQVMKGGLLVSFLVILFLVVVLAHIFRPLVDSAAQMRDMAKGDTPLAPLPLVRHDEVGAMVKSFNELVIRLLQSQKQMSYLAHHDPLTGLPNRMAFQASMAQSIALAERQKGSLAVLFMDLDGFKLVNDTHGHDIGDLLLQQVATRLRECVRASDIIGRIGGDEFVLLMTDNPSEAEAGQIARKLIARVSEPYTIGNRLLAIGASIGIALYPDDADTADQLLVLADSAMYVAKRGGGQRHHVSGDSSNASTY